MEENKRTHIKEKKHVNVKISHHTSQPQVSNARGGTVVKGLYGAS